jgi:hypothetical protein
MMLLSARLLPHLTHIYPRFSTHLPLPLVQLPLQGRQPCVGGALELHRRRRRGGAGAHGGRVWRG